MNAVNEREARAGNTPFDVLLQSDKKFYPTVSRYLARLAAGRGVHPSEIDLVVEKAWTQAVQHRCQFTGDEIKRDLIAWLTAAVVGNSVDVLRHQRRHPCQTLKASGEKLIDATQAKQAETAEQKEWLNTQLERVRPGNEENGHLLCMHYLQEFSIHELAQMYGMTTDAVDSRIRRVLKKLRALAG